MPQLVSFSRRPCEKGLSTGNDVANTDTEILSVASLSAIFESQCRFMFVVMPAPHPIILRQF